MSGQERHGCPKHYPYQFATVAGDTILRGASGGRAARLSQGCTGAKYVTQQHEPQVLAPNNVRSQGALPCLQPAVCLQKQTFREVGRAY